MLQLDWTEQG